MPLRGGCGSFGALSACGRPRLGLRVPLRTALPRLGSLRRQDGVAGRECCVEGEH